MPRHQGRCGTITHSTSRRDAIKPALDWVDETMMQLQRLNQCSFWLRASSNFMHWHSTMIRSRLTSIRGTRLLASRDE
jgi:hypothetical protein